MVSKENENSNQDSIGCISDNKANLFLSSGGNAESSSRNLHGTSNMDAETIPRKDLVDDSSLNMSRASAEESMEDVKIQQLIVEMRNMHEQIRKETKSMIKENRNEMKCMIEKMRKENKRLDQNFRTMFTNKIYKELIKEDESMKDETISQHN